MRRADPAVKQYLEALLIAHADVRQRKSQWALADSVVGLTLGNDGSVKPTDTTSILIQQDTAETAFFQDSELDRILPFTCAIVEWGGTEPAEVEIKQVIAKLHPRRDPAQPKQIAEIKGWRLDLMRLERAGGILGNPPRRQLTLAPLCDPIYADAKGDAEGYVTFDYSVEPIAARPKPKSRGLAVLAQRLGILFQVGPTPVTFLIFSALKANGQPAGNVGLAYDAAQPFVNNLGN